MANETTNITYEQLQDIHGAEADAVASQILDIHRGCSLYDFKSQIGGIDFSGCSTDNKAKIEQLLTKKKEGK